MSVSQHFRSQRASLTPLGHRAEQGFDLQVAELDLSPQVHALFQKLVCLGSSSNESNESFTTQGQKYHEVFEVVKNLEL